MASISRLGHVGLYCEDLATQAAFYTEVLGLVKTDEDPEHGLVFLSARPDVEHHELLLAAGRNAGREAQVVQQVSFRCDGLDDVRGFYATFRERGVPLDMVVSHGNAIGIYFYDPEGNRCEVYWNTGLVARQPFVMPIDLTASSETILEQVRAMVDRFGADGVVDEATFATQQIG